MALGPDPLDEATRAAREQDSDWPELAGRIKERVRAVRLPSRPLALFGPDGERLLDGGSPLTMPSRDLLTSLRLLLQAPTHAPEDISLTITDGRLAGVVVELVVRYGEQVRPLLDDVWHEVAGAVRDQVGPDPALVPERDVVVRAVDVVDGDPRVV